ncbi:MAG: serine/threonine-protein kinase, partial [Myxococcales bacterium]|nr:serine/threonine-protein kinase [Myxococcales bacterium]
MAQTTQGDERVGDRIADKYHLTRLLGSGGMGAVYEATHQFTQRRVAVKLMHPQFARSGVAAERFVRESQAPSSIGHPGIVEVLDGGYDNDGSLYLVLELLEGRTLSDDLEQGRMDPDALGHVMLELLDALEAAHAAGFVHRDIKPENIFLVGMDDEPRVKLLDFGVAGVLADDEDNPNLTKAGSVLGTPLYMSPEQAKGRSVDARSDLWSVGAVMYQALTGRPPFGGDNFQALVVSIVTQEHFPLETVRPDLPVRVTTVVERALEKEPQERWQDAGEMAAALQQALEARRRSATAAERPRAMRAERAAQGARIAAQPEP